MPSQAEVEAAFYAIEDANEKTSGLTYSDLLMCFAQRALEAAERVRATERRQNCRHPNKRGSGTVGSDGSSSWDWYCPDCGKSDSGRTEGRQDLMITTLNNR